MRKTDLVAAVADIVDIPTNKAEDAVSSILELVTNSLARGEAVNLVGFGSFSVKARAARMGRNPRTGDAMEIPASNQVQFKPGKLIKSALNE